MEPMIENGEKPLYDLGMLIRMGNPDFLMKMLNIFVVEIPDAVVKMKNAYTTGNLEEVEYLAHRMRPSLQNLGVESVIKDISEIEYRSGKGEISPQMKLMIDNITNITGLVIADIKSKYRIS